MQDYNGQDYGKCPYCGDDRVLNPKTGKTFCRSKCWLKKGSGSLETQRMVASTTPTPNNSSERIVALLESIDDKLGRIEDKLPVYADIDGKPQRVPF